MTRTARSSDVAKALGVSPASIQRYARDGLIPYATTVGGHRRFDVDEVREALEAMEGFGRPAPPAAGVARRACTAVILTALGSEMAAVMRHISAPVGRRLRSGTRYEMGRLSGQSIDWTIYAAEIGEGNIGAATEATAAIHELDPDIVLFVGVAGSLKPELPHGSVVVASKVYSYLSGKAGDEFLPRPVVFPTWHGLSQLVRTVRRTRWTDVDPQPVVELKPIAAGERVVASKASDDFRLLRELYNDAVAVDMESAGLYLAAERAERLPALAIRGISDMIADKVPDADEHWQPVAAANAAAFAFALLRAADPLDLPLGPSPAPYPSERAELLGSIPPPVAVAIERAMGRDQTSALELLRALSKTDRSPPEIVGDLLATTSPIASSADPDVWAAVGEFAVAHSEHRGGAIAFHRAAVQHDPQEAGRWYARAALAYAADGQMSRATAELTEARSATVDPSPFVDVIEAALAEDVERIIQAARKQQPEDPLVDLMLVKALEVTGAVDEAIEVARNSLARAPSRAMTGGLAMAAAKLLVRRAQESPASTITTRDLHEAQELALLVRDLRRSWRGPSPEAAFVAAVAAFEAGDREGALRIALPEPDGRATDMEAADPALTKVAANVTMALRRFDQARDLAASIQEPVDRLLVEVDCDIAEGNASQETVARLIAAIPNAEPGARFRAYLQLAELGAWPLPDLSLLEDAEAAEIVVAEAEIKQGRGDDGVRRLRALVSPRGRAFLINAYVEAGKIPEAVEALRDGAQRFGEPRNLLRAASLLATGGNFEQAKLEAERALALVPGRSHLARELRGLLMEVSSRLRDWTAVAAHANAAISDGFDTNEVRWAIVWAHFSRRDIQAALTAWRSSSLRPRNEDEAILITQLLRSAPQDQDTVAQLLDVAEQYQGSERVSASAFAAVFEVSRELNLSDEAVTRLQALSEAFFGKWPESPLLRRIDVSDLNTLVDYLRDTLATSAKEQEQIAQKVQLGELPYGMLAASVGRSLAEALIKNAAGCIPAGQPDPALAASEDQVCASTADKVVVADSAALVVAARTGLDPSLLLAFFAAVHAASTTLDDAFVAADALRLRSTSTMGWNPRQAKPVLVAIEPAQADEWARDAEGLLRRVRDCQIRDVHELGRERDVAIDVMLSPVRLAQELGSPLWSDDRAMRSLARNEGVVSFGTPSILRAMAASGRLDSAALADAFLTLMRHSVVDFDVAPGLVLRLAEEEDWRGGRAGLILSRPSYWIRPEPALEVYTKGVTKAAARDETTLAQWSFAAAMGAGRRLGSARQCDTIAAVMLSGFAALDVVARLLPHLLIGARAAAELRECEDPLLPAARMLSASMRQQFGEVTAAKLFSRAISELNPEDRATAFGVLVQRS